MFSKIDTIIEPYRNIYESFRMLTLLEKMLLAGWFLEVAAVMSLIMFTTHTVVIVKANVQRFANYLVAIFYC